MFFPAWAVSGKWKHLHKFQFEGLKHTSKHQDRRQNVAKQLTSFVTVMDKSATACVIKHCFIGVVMHKPHPLPQQNLELTVCKIVQYYGFILLNAHSPVNKVIP